MKKIDPEKFGSLKTGDIIFVEVVGFKEEGETTKVYMMPKERGRLLAIYSKEREIKKDDKWTGKFETVADLVMYEKIDDAGNKPTGYHYTVVMCGFFKIYTEKGEDV